MADKKISALTAATTPLSGSEVLPIVQGGSTVKVSISGVTAGRAMSALSSSFGTGTPAYSIGGTQVGITNTSASAYLSVYGGAGSTNGGFLLGGNNSENFANVFWNGTGNYMQLGTSPVGSKVQFNIEGIVVGDITSAGFAFAAGKGVTTSSATALGLGVNGAVTAMSIDTSSNILMGTTTNVNTARLFVRGAADAMGVQVPSTAAAQAAIVFYDGANDYCGQIQIDPSTNATLYVSASDRSLKENIADAPDASHIIDSIQVRQFDWIGRGTHQDYGFIAQELKEVFPSAVADATSDQQKMGVDNSKLIPILIKEIQSLRARVAQLESA